MTQREEHTMHKEEFLRRANTGTLGPITEVAEYEAKALRFLNPRMAENLAEAGLMNAILGVCGEAGELADLLKKHLHQGHPLHIGELAEEAGDVLWYVALLCRVLGFSLGEVMAGNIRKLERRYGDRFSVEKSLHREGE